MKIPGQNKVEPSKIRIPKIAAGSKTKNAQPVE